MASGRLGKRSEWIQANNYTEDYSTGDLVETRGADFFFWAEVMDKKSLNGYVNDKRIDNHTLGLMVDSRDVRDVSLGTEIRLDSNDNVYSVEDVYDAEFKFGAVIVCSSISN